MKQRDLTIDILKGWGTAFVIIGHMFSDPSYNYFYNFHMGLFFFAAGYLALNEPPGMKFLDFVKRKAKSILLPYTELFIFSLIFVFTIKKIVGMKIEPVSPLEILKIYLLNGGYLYNDAVIDYPLWFLPHFFICLVCFYFIRKLKNNWLIGGTAVALMLVTIPFQNLFDGDPAFQINALPAALVAMIGGWFFAKFRRSRFYFENTYLGLGLIVISFVASFFYHGKIIRINHMMYFPIMFIAILGWYYVSCGSTNKLLKYMGENSLYIYGLHNFVIMIFSRRLMKFLTAHGVHGLPFYAATIFLVFAAVFAMREVYVRGKLLIKKAKDELLKRIKEAKTA